MSESIVGPWAQTKLNLLKDYLAAYTTILRRQTWCEEYRYVDAFAGPGIHNVRSPKSANIDQPFLPELMADARNDAEQQQFLAGSPRIALEIQHPFTSYVFVEKSGRRVAELQKLKSEFGRFRQIEICQDDCATYLDRMVTGKNWNNRRAFVFLDPFGMQVNWKVIERLGQTEAIEILLNFPIGMAIQRLLLRNPGRLNDSRRKMLDAYFGSTEWFDVLYTRKQASLLDVDEYEKVDQSGQKLLKWYSARLRKSFGHVSKATLVRNTKGGHLYYLLLATPKAVGAKIANDLVRKFGDEAAH